MQDHLPATWGHGFTGRGSSWIFGCGGRRRIGERDRTEHVGTVLRPAGRRPFPSPEPSVPAGALGLKPRSATAQHEPAADEDGAAQAEEEDTAGEGKNHGQTPARRVGHL